MDNETNRSGSTASQSPLLSQEAHKYHSKLYDLSNKFVFKKVSED